MTFRSAAPQQSTFERVFELEDISIRAAAQGGDGRTVEAYCAVYNRPVHVNDWEGEYEEIIRSGAFAKTIAERRTRFQVFYNHAKDIYGVPAAEFSKPIGVPIEVKETSKGVLTVTRYVETPLGDEILELIRAGAITGQSFSGKWMNSRLIKAKRAGELDTVERLEVAMREYGPCPFPVYESASILGVRAQQLAERLGIDPTKIAELSDDDRRELVHLFSAGTPLEAAPAPPGSTSEEPSGDDTPPPAADTAPDEGPSLEDQLRELDLRRRLATS